MLARYNTILRKLGRYAIRSAGHFERQIDEYGIKGKWVIDTGERQALTAYPTQRAAFKAALWQDQGSLSLDKLTSKEQAIVAHALRG